MYFIKDLPLYKEEKPFAIDQLLPNTDFPITNIEYEKHEIQVHDVRDDESKPEFDTHSFCYVNYPSKFGHLKTEEEMMWPYAKETTDLLKEKFGTDRAICFDLRVRPNFWVSIGTVIADGHDYSGDGTKPSLKKSWCLVIALFLPLQFTKRTWVKPFEFTSSPHSKSFTKHS